MQVRSLHKRVLIYTFVPLRRILSCFFNYEGLLLLFQVIFFYLLLVLVQASSIRLIRPLIWGPSCNVFRAIKPYLDNHPDPNVSLNTFGIYFSNWWKSLLKHILGLIFAPSVFSSLIQALPKFSKPFPNTKDLYNIDWTLCRPTVTWTIYSRGISKF